ncbi:phage tail protein [Dyella marensis]|uniref:Phage-related protein n=1 Tax=Dyella marensis TaxID=500610 RepID=A0A1I1ZX00_9GAMM|nr:MULTISPECIES: phage tail protein [Dyella]SFE36334.1 Phage-related protein [Dyella marensis]
MPDIFTWRPINNPVGQVTLRVRRAQFGDGYSQEVQDGINNKVQSWPLQFVGSRAEMQALSDFLDAHAGAIGFLWTPPVGVQGLYKAASYSPGYEGGDVYTISTTFEQKFSP